MLNVPIRSKSHTHVLGRIVSIWLSPPRVLGWDFAILVPIAPAPGRCLYLPFLQNCLKSFWFLVKEFPFTVGAWNDMR